MEMEMEMESPRNQPRRRRAGRDKKRAVKITYFSNPMMVKANSASEFRAIVQELTGCNSNPERMEYSWSSTVVDAANSISDINPICPTTSMFDQGFVWRESSNDLPGFQFPLA